MTKTTEINSSVSLKESSTNDLLEDGFPQTLIVQQAFRVSQ